MKLKTTEEIEPLEKERRLLKKESGKHSFSKPIVLIAIAGIALGFLRVRFGLIWSILLHCVDNSFFIIFSSLSEM